MMQLFNSSSLTYLISNTLLMLSFRNLMHDAGFQKIDGEKKRAFPRGPKPAIAPKPTIPPKPKNIKRQGHSCDIVIDENKSRNVQKRTTPKSTSMSILSPVDVDKEWANIALYMDCFSGTGMVGGMVLISFLGNS